MIHTYYINVTQFEDERLFREKFNLLSSCRQQKIAQLKQEKDKRRSLGAGLALDYALRRYGQGLRERDMEYVFGEWGKPSLRDYPEICFSLSHSGDYAMCSIGESPVGNDIECIRAGRLKVAERFFTERERAFLYSHPDLRAEGGKERKREKSLARDMQGRNDEETTQRMFRIWTMKESFLKATGVGMTLPLKDFSVIVDEKRDMVRVEHRFDDVVYHMKEYGEIPGYRAAVCCRAGSEMADRMEPAEI